MLRRDLLIGAWFIFAMSAPVHAENVSADQKPITITDRGGQPAHFGIAEMKALLPVESEMTCMTKNGNKTARYKGVLLWNALRSLGMGKPVGHHEELRQTLLVGGKDGYAVTFSLGEIAPDFGDKAILIADEADGGPLEKGLRLVVPGDRRGARSVADVVSIDIR